MPVYTHSKGSKGSKSSQTSIASIYVKSNKRKASSDSVTLSGTALEEFLVFQNSRSQTAQKKTTKVQKKAEEEARTKSEFHKLFFTFLIPLFRYSGS